MVLQAGYLTTINKISECQSGEERVEEQGLKLVHYTAGVLFGSEYCFHHRTKQIGKHHLLCSSHFLKVWGQRETEKSYLVDFFPWEKRRASAKPLGTRCKDLILTALGPATSAI